MWRTSSPSSPFAASEMATSARAGRHSPRGMVVAVAEMARSRSTSAPRATSPSNWSTVRRSGRCHHNAFAALDFFFVIAVAYNLFDDWENLILMHEHRLAGTSNFTATLVSCAYKNKTIFCTSVTNMWLE